MAEAIRLGCDMIETDVRRRSSDGELVVAHDRGPNLDAPLLRDALMLCQRANMPMNLDLKQNGIAHQFVDDVRSASMTERIVITGGGWEQAIYIRHLEQRIRIGFTIPRRHHDWIRALGWAANRVWRYVWTGRVDLLMKAYRIDLVTVQFRLVTPRLINQVHRAGGEIWCWTPDDPVVIERLVDMGVDGICTNTPDPARVAAISAAIAA
jgi:glycerophosphoryl diester phosphodiesterase